MMKYVFLLTLLLFGAVGAALGGAAVVARDPATLEAAVDDPGRAGAGENSRQPRFQFWRA